MRISDWSSDVCSSDLTTPGRTRSAPSWSTSPRSRSPPADRLTADCAGCGGGQTAPASRSRSGISQRYGNDIVSDHNDLLEETGAPRSEARHARVPVTIEQIGRAHV